MRRLSLLLVTTIAFFIILFSFLRLQTSSLQKPESFLTTNQQASKNDVSKQDELVSQASKVSLELTEDGIAHDKPITPGLTQGHVIMPPLGNETIKYGKLNSLLTIREELGRASWKLFHTILGRFPENPTIDEREALKSYIHLFARLYPCGEWYTSESFL
jgi:hypothetical protein